MKLTILSIDIYKNIPQNTCTCTFHKESGVKVVYISPQFRGKDNVSQSTGGEEREKNRSNSFFRLKPGNNNYHPDNRQWHKNEINVSKFIFNAEQHRYSNYYNN